MRVLEVKERKPTKLKIIEDSAADELLPANPVRCTKRTNVLGARTDGLPF
jgi:hypothetical protein